LIAHINSLIDSLSHDHRRGAAEIVEDMAELFIAIAMTGVQEPDEADRLFRRAVKRLAQGQPSMAPVLNILNHICFEIERLGDNWAELKRAFTELQQKQKSQLEGMIARLDEVPKVKDTLLTFSNSSTVAGMIIASRERGWSGRVICGEGRPILEGLVMAKRLTAAGIPVTVYTDAALMSHIVDADAVWIGGDALDEKGLVNKIGSLALAIMAKTLDIRFISFMGSDKLLSKDMNQFFHFLTQNPREVAMDYADELVVVNEYYEHIPLELVENVFTEKGLFRPADLLESCRQEKASELFKELARDSG
jgi:translation initiation factor 2B subunit (eIF-2B alpha/beta/delta family)